MPRRIVPAVIALAVVFALPSLASAATWTVDLDSPGTVDQPCTNHVCKTITKANEAAASGDTILIKDGSYVEPPIVFTHDHLIVKAEHPGKVSITSSSTTAGDNVIQFGGSHVECLDPLCILTTTVVDHDGDGGSLDGVTVNVQANGGHAVNLLAKDVTISHCTLARLTASSGDDADQPVVELDDRIGGGLTTLTGDQIVQGTGTRGAVTMTLGGGALQVFDSFIVAATGWGVRYAGIDSARGANMLVRSQVYALDAAADAVRIDSPDGGGGQGTKILKIDSSILSAGQNGAGIHATASSGGGGDSEIRIEATHATIAGSLRAVSLDGSGGDTGDGNINAVFDKSIIHSTGGNIVLGNDPDPTLADNTVAMDIGHSDTDQPAAANVTVHNNSNTPVTKLFVDDVKRNFHLRADATAAIDAVDGPTAGESAKDVDGDTRLSGLKSDKGADEFINHAPAAVLAVSNASPPQNEVLDFDASKSSDPDVGGGVVSYSWDFGDGTTATTSSSHTAHSYAAIGTYTATVTVTDAQGASSTPSVPVVINVRDGIPPTVRINAPKPNQSFHIFKNKVTKKKVIVEIDGKKVTQIKRIVTKVRNRFRFFGSAGDENGVAAVAISLRRVSLTKTAKSSATANCVFFSKRVFLAKPCSKPIYFYVSFKDGVWTYRTKSTTHFRAGTYQLSVRAVDTNGVVSLPSTVTFFLKK